MDADLLDGYHGASASTVSTYALRDGSGDINARLFRSEYDSTNGTIGYIMTQIDTASNNYIRPSTPAQLAAGTYSSFESYLLTGITNGTGISGGCTSGTCTLNATLGTAIEKGEISNSGTLSFDWADSEIADDIRAGNLDGVDSSQFLRSDVDDNLTAAIVVPTGNRDEGVFGTYDSTKTQHIWSMGTGYRNNAAGTNFGNLYGMAYCHTNNASCTAGLGHQVEFVNNGTVGAAIGMAGGIWTSGAITGASYYLGGNYLDNVTGQYGSVQINGAGSGGWEGYSIDGRMVLMHDGSEATGLYDDTVNRWVTLYDKDSYYRIYEPDSANVAVNIDVAGNVGIGTTVPGRALDVNSGIIRINNYSGSTPSLTGEGDFAIGNSGTANDGGRFWVRSGSTTFRFISYNNAADYSEFFYNGEDKTEVGDVITIDENTPSPIDGTGKVKKADTPYQEQLLGVVTENDRGTGGNDPDIDDSRGHDDNYSNVGLLGHVYTKVSTINGPIQEGDPLTSSSIPGVAMKATQAGQIVGRALESYTDSNPENIKKIMVYVKATWFDPQKDNYASNLVKAIQELDIKIEDIQAQVNQTLLQDNSNIFESILSWLSDKVVTAKNFFAERFVASKELCIDDVCINKNQLQALLSSGEVSTPTPQAVGGASNPADTVPPTLTLLGNNPANIEVGTTYHDLGVTIEDNVDNNLGYEVWRCNIHENIETQEQENNDDCEYLGRNLTGTTVDTTQASEWLISYVAEDQAGNVATTTRTIIITDSINEVAPPEEERPQDDETATTTPEVIETETEDPVATAESGQATTTSEVGGE